jgi:hypothetical protein
MLMILETFHIIEKCDEKGLRKQEKKDSIGANFY